MNATDDLPTTITLSGQHYDIGQLDEKALAQLRGIQFCDRQIQQLRSEWAVADTARLGYLHALSAEIVSDGSEVERD